MKHMMRRAIQLLAVSLLLPFWPAGDADAVFESALRGDYSETLYRSCTNAPPGYTFGPNFELTSIGAPVGVTLQDFVLRGTLHYNGDGTGNLNGQSLATFTAVLPSTAGQTVVPLSQSNTTCTLTYTVNADGTFSQTANCNLTVVVGSTPGATLTLNGITVSGQITLDGTVLVFNDTVPNVETFTWTSGPLSGTTFQRVCTGSGTATSRR